MEKMEKHLLLKIIKTDARGMADEHDFSLIGGWLFDNLAFRKVSNA